MVYFLRHDPERPATVALTKVEQAPLILTGNNCYSGMTTVGSGTLQVGDATMSGGLGSGAVTDNAALALDLYGSPMVANAIAGSGSLTQSGGTLTLAGDDSYSGATAVSSGRNAADRQRQRPSHPAGTAGITVNGTLDLAGYSPAVGSLSGSGTVTSSIAGAAMLNVGDNNQSSTFSGAIDDGMGSVARRKPARAR